jgi:hypothetical protein
MAGGGCGEVEETGVERMRGAVHEVEGEIGVRAGAAPVNEGGLGGEIGFVDEGLDGVGGEMEMKFGRG